jgi:alpha-tubulin suppressor-like RCC1 family protein
MIRWAAMSPTRAALALCLPLCGCRGATQISVEVTTDVDCAAYTATTLTVGRLGAINPASPATQASSCGPNGRIGSVVIVPSGADDEAVAVEVVGGVGVDPTRCAEPDIAPKCITARRSLRFIPHETLRIDLPLRGECRGIPCTAVSTCVHGACVPATIEDPSQCQGSGCGEGALGPGTAADAGAPDATLDASGPPDASTDAPIDAPSIVDAPTDVTGPVKEMALGLDHSCALMNDGTVTCWGENDLGQLGSGDAPSPNVLRPQKVPGLSGIKAIRAFSEANVAVILANDTVMMWGADDNGQLGDPQRGIASPSPIPVPGLANVGAIAIGRANACALGTDLSTLNCWGAIAAPDFVAPAPTAVAGVTSKVRDLQVGDNLVVLHMADGTVRTLGSNYGGSNGDGSLDAGPRSAAAAVSGITGALEVATGNVDVLVRLVDGGVVGWGANAALELGIDSFTPFPGPTPSPKLAGLTGIVLGDLHGCGLRGTQVVCWGDNDLKQIGSDTLPRSATPVVVPGLPPVTKLWAGWAHTCARATDGEIYCWGRNDFGQLGDGTVGSRATPMPVKW